MAQRRAKSLNDEKNLLQRELEQNAPALLATLADTISGRPPTCCWLARGAIRMVRQPGYSHLATGTRQRMAGIAEHLRSAQFNLDEKNRSGSRACLTFRHLCADRCNTSGRSTGRSSRTHDTDRPHGISAGQVVAAAANDSRQTFTPSAARHSPVRPRHCTQRSRSPRYCAVCRSGSEQSQSAWRTQHVMEHRGGLLCEKLLSPC